MAKLIEELKLKYEKTKQALTTLKEAIKSIEELEKSEIQTSILGKTKKDLKRIFNDSMVQRFEYSYDMLWKYLKSYLEIELKAGVNIKSPRNVFREYFKIGIITEDESRKALDIIDDRNLTTHLYNDKLVEEICTKIPQHYKLMKKLLDKTKIG